LVSTVVTALLIGLLPGSARAAFSAPFTVSPAGVKGPQIASDADGDAIAVWSGFDGTDWRVEARRISADGSLGHLKVLSAASPKPLFPHIASGAHGDAVAVWTQLNSRETNQRVKARRISPGGALGPVKTLSRAKRKARAAEVATDAHGDAVAVWLQAHRGTWRVKARRIFAGGALGPVRSLSSASQKAEGPQIASDARADVVAAWSQFDGANWRVKARRISAAGALGRVKTLSRRGHDAGLSAIASGAHGNAVAVWSQFNSRGTNRRVKARRISRKGALGRVKTLSPAGQYALAPQVASDADGNAIVVWMRSGGATEQIQARQVSAAGVLGPVQILSDSRYAYSPQIASDAHGDAVAVWYGHDADAAPASIQARTISAAGVLGPVQTLSAGGPATQPRVVAAAQGDAVAVWLRLEGTQWRVEGSLGP